MASQQELDSITVEEQTDGSGANFDTSATTMTSWTQIDRLLEAQRLWSLPPSERWQRQYQTACHISTTASDSNPPTAQLVDEYYKGVKYSPDGLCLLTCVESGAISSNNLRRHKRFKVNHAPRPSATSQTRTRDEEEQKVSLKMTEETKMDTSSTSSLSSSSESSSSESSSEEEDEDANDEATPVDPNDRRGLSLFELPGLRWQDRSSQTTPDGATLASSWVYASSSDATTAAPSQPLHPLLQCHPGDSIYDFCWNPSMHSARPETCFFLSTARSNPIHSWDAFTGQLRATYSGINQMDELETAISLCMAPSQTSAGGTAEGSSDNKLYAGYNKSIRIFDIERPGRESIRIPTFQKSGTSSKKVRGRGRASSTGPNLSQSGIISTMAINPVHRQLLAAGSYNGEIGLYDLNAAGGAHGQSGLDHKLFLDSHGVSQVEFSVDGLYMFASVRCGAHILIYDMRQATESIARLPRQSRTNQRMYFDLDRTYGSRYLATGDSKGQLLIFDLLIAPHETTTEIPPILTQTIAGDALCGVSLHPHFTSTLPLLATCSGERLFFLDENESDTEASGVLDSSSSLLQTDSHKRKLESTIRASLPANEQSLGVSSASTAPLNSLSLWSLEHTVLKSTPPEQLPSNE